MPNGDPRDITPDLYAGMHPAFAPRLQSLQDMLRESYGLETSVDSGLRDMQTQARIYAQGRSTPGKVVTYAPPGSSYHNYGAAADLRPVNMPEAQASEVLARAIKENPEFGVRGIGAWDPFHVQLNAPISGLNSSNAGLPAYSQHEPAGPPRQAEDYRTPTLAYGTLAAATDNPADRAALGATNTPGGVSVVTTNTPQSMAPAMMAMAQQNRERDAKEWDDIFARLRMGGTKAMI